ncbi:unnamed protein product [Lepeophtheirus salmonis]|uniref:(salmon louse) hypothetical protein n=1 Tax=Lepeophtheirus salmonis TaxID=72036 RepID=A0A7R8D0B0_LEPSM|nr:unnamed protein product [Lepeophtheirus salmonis]CAF2982609.1 unnamed protein product [Lepeophtheirus salmonis]
MVERMCCRGLQEHFRLCVWKLESHFTDCLRHKKVREKRGSKLFREKIGRLGNMETIESSYQERKKEIDDKYFANFRIEEVASDEDITKHRKKSNNESHIISDHEYAIPHDKDLLGKKMKN